MCLLESVADENCLVVTLRPMNDAQPTVTPHDGHLALIIGLISEHAESLLQYCWIMLGDDNAAQAALRRALLAATHGLSPGDHDPGDPECADHGGNRAYSGRPADSGYVGDSRCPGYSGRRAMLRVQVRPGKAGWALVRISPGGITVYVTWAGPAPRTRHRRPRRRRTRHQAPRPHPPRLRRRRSPRHSRPLHRHRCRPAHPGEPEQVSM